MTTTQEYESMYAALNERDAQLVRDIDTIAVDYLAKITALVNAQPKGAEKSPAGQFLSRVAGVTTGVFGFDLTSMRTLYGITDDAPAAGDAGAQAAAQTASA